jgi:hypothetical protein
LFIPRSEPFEEVPDAAESGTDELKLLKTWFDRLAQESASIDDIEKIFDAQIRYRFGELIGRAASNFRVLAEIGLPHRQK